MKRKFDVDNVEDALITFQMDKKFELNCNNFELAIYIVEYINGEY